MNMGWWSVCLGAFLWGTAGVAAKVMIAEYGMDALSVAAWRIFLSLPVLLVAVFVESAKSGNVGSIRPGHWGWLILFGALLAGYQGSFFMSVEMTQVSTATLIAICSAPIMVAVAARFLFKEALGFRTLLAMGLGITGVFLLVGVDSVTGLAEHGNFQGNVWALAAAGCFAGYLLIGKKLLREVSPFRVTGYAFLIGAGWLIPVVQFPPPSWSAWLLLGYLGMVPTGLAYLLYIRGLRTTTATRAAVGGLLEPLTATFLAIIFLGEGFSPAGVGGMALLLLSLLLLSLVREKKEKQLNESADELFTSGS